MNPFTNGRTAVLTIIILFSSCIYSFAQHQPELWGVTGYGGPEDQGYIFKYDVRANKLTRMAWLNKNTFVSYFTEFFASDSNGLYAIKTQNDSVDRSAIVYWKPATNELKTLYQFDPAKYGGVSGSLTAFNGKYYGLAYSGWRGPYQPVNGIIFEWDPTTNTVTNKHYFETTPTGRWPWGKLVLHNNKFYGVATYGGTSDNGLLFEWDPVTNAYTPKTFFNQATYGGHPNGFLQLHNGKLYGICMLGGAASKGTLFEYDLGTNLVRKIHDFASKPVWGKPVLVNGKLYTVAEEGWGEVIEIDVATRTSVRHYPFGPANVYHYNSPLTYYNGNFYMAGSLAWGSTDSSAICRWKPGEPAVTQIGSYNIYNVGKDVVGPLTAFNGKLYGITTRGSISGRGSVFEVDSAAGKVNFKTHFGTNIDAYSTFAANGNLLYHKNRFYVTAFDGGHFNKGVLYSVEPETGLMSRLYDFTEPKGHHPYGDLFIDQNGRLEGLTSAGPFGSFYDHHYRFNLNDSSLTWLGELNPVSGLPFEHGIEAHYAAVNGVVYIARPQDGPDAAGLFRYDAASQSFVRIFTFPIAIMLIHERSLTAYNGKLYGIGILRINSLNTYVIYEFDPSNNNFRYKALSTVVSMNNRAFMGKPVELNNRLYVFTTEGCGNKGSLIEWDMTADTAYQHCLDNSTLSGNLYGVLTVADGKLYGYTQNGICCFDPVARTFKNVFIGTPSFFGINHYDYAKKLTFRLSNSSPKVNAAALVNICLNDSLTRNIPFTASDAEMDSFRLSVSVSDAALIPPAGISIINQGNQQYILRFTITNRAGDASITIHAIDTMDAAGYREIKVSARLRKPVALQFSTDSICTRDSALLLTGGSPAGGYYFIDGVQTDSLAPAALTEGEHVLMYKYMNGTCVDSASKVLKVVACSVPNERANLVVYPNPSPGEVRIDNKDNLLSVITVYTAQGDKILEKRSSDNPIRLQLGKFRNGIYYIIVHNEKGSSSGSVEIMK